MPWVPQSSTTLGSGRGNAEALQPETPSPRRSPIPCQAELSATSSLSAAAASLCAHRRRCLALLSEIYHSHQRQKRKMPAWEQTPALPHF